MDVAGESSVRWHFLSSNNSVGKLCDEWVLSASVCVARSPVDFCYATTEAERRPLVVSVPIPLRTQLAKAPTRHKTFLLNYGNKKRVNEHLAQTIFLLFTHYPQTCILRTSQTRPSVPKEDFLCYYSALTWE